MNLLLGISYLLHLGGILVPRVVGDVNEIPFGTRTIPTERRRQTLTSRSPHDLQLQTHSVDHYGNHNHPKILNIDTKCTPDQISLTVDFDSPFYGIIYTKGHFGNPACRFVEDNSIGSRQLSFKIPANGCDTQVQEISKTLTNVLIFQMDETVQEIWDTARRISCNYGGNTNKHGKMVIFKPLSVGMLDVEHHPIKSEFLDCWMDIQRGKFPNIAPIEGQIPIGEELSVLIYIRDEEKEYDVSVKDCWAFDSMNFEDSKSSKVQLTGFDGCPRKVKLIGQWQKTFDTGNSGATTIAFTNMTAFKFPESGNVHLTCNIELCRGLCGEESCDSSLGVSRPLTPGTSTSKPLRITTALTPQPIRTVYNQKPSDPRIPQISDQRPTQPSSIGTTKIPSFCKPGSQHPDCLQFTANTNPSQQPTFGPNQQYEGEDENLDTGYPTPGQREQPYDYQKPTSTSTAPEQDGEQPLCYPGQNDPHCRRPVVTSKFPSDGDESIYSTPNQSITPSTTTCRPGVNCAKDTTGPYSSKDEGDEEVLNNSYQTTKQPQRPYDYQRPTSTMRTPTQNGPITGSKPVCYPGQNDPRCRSPAVSSGQEGYVYSVPKATNKPASFCEPGTNCDNEGPGSVTPKDEGEEQILGNEYQTTRRPNSQYDYQRPTTTIMPKKNGITSQPQLQCYPGQNDPRCRRPPTTPSSGSTYVYSQPGTTKTPSYTQPDEREDDNLSTGYPYSTTRQPGQSNDNKRPNTTPTRNGVASQTQPLCYPGQNDPRCRKPSTSPSVDSGYVYPKPGTTKFPSYTQPDERDEDISNNGYSSTQQPERPSGPNIPTTPTATKNGITIQPKPLCSSGQNDPRCRKPPTSPSAGNNYVYSQPGTTRIPSTQQPDERDEENLSTGYQSTRQPETPTGYKRPITPTATKNGITIQPEPLCYPGQNDPRCRKPTVSSPTEEGYVYQAPKTTKQPQFVYQPTTTGKPPVCYPGATDPRCQNPDLTTNYGQEVTQPEEYTTGKTYDYGTPSTTLSPSFVYQSSINEGETQKDNEGYTTTQKPYNYQTVGTTRRPSEYQSSQSNGRTQPPGTTNKSVLCYPGQSDPRCLNGYPKGTTTEGYEQEKDNDYFTTTQRPREHSTTRQPIDYQTSKITQKPYEYEKATTPTRTPYGYQTPSTTQRPQYSTTKQVLCYPGQPDPRCPNSYKKPTTTGPEQEKDNQGYYSTTRRPYDYQTTAQPIKTSGTSRTTTQPTRTSGTTRKPYEYQTPSAPQRTQTPSTTRKPQYEYQDPSTPQRTQTPSTTSKPYYEYQDPSTPQRTQIPSTTRKPQYEYQDPSTPQRTQTPSTTRKPQYEYQTPSTPQRTPTPSTTRKPQYEYQTPSAPQKTQTLSTTRKPYYEYQDPSTPQRTQVPTTTRKPYYEYQDPSTPQRTQAPTTTRKPYYEYQDPSTPQRTPSTTRKPYYEYQDPSTTPRTQMPSTTKSLSCYPGDPDPRCRDSYTTSKYDEEKANEPTFVTTPGAPYKYPTPTTRKPYEHSAPNIPTRRNETSKPIVCYPGQSDPRCAPNYTKPTPTVNNYEEKQEDNEYYTSTQKPNRYNQDTLTSTSKPIKYDTTTKQPYKYDTSGKPQTYDTVKNPLDYETTRQPYRQEVPSTTKTPYEFDTTRKPYASPPQNGQSNFPQEGYLYQPSSKNSFPNQPIRQQPTAAPRQPTPAENYYGLNNENEVQEHTTQKQVNPFQPFFDKSNRTTGPATYDSSSEPVVCYPGRIDYRCPMQCYEGSSDSRCQKPTTPPETQNYEDESAYGPKGYQPNEPLTSYPREPSKSITTSTFRPFTYPGEQPTKYTKTNRPVVCYPGQIDPRCPKVCYEGSTDRRCSGYNRKREVIDQLKCFAHSTDPRCPKFS